MSYHYLFFMDWKTWKALIVIKFILAVSFSGLYGIYCLLDREMAVVKYYEAVILEKLIEPSSTETDLLPLILPNQVFIASSSYETGDKYYMRFLIGGSESVHAMPYDSFMRFHEGDTLSLGIPCGYFSGEWKY